MIEKDPNQPEILVLEREVFWLPELEWAFQGTGCSVVNLRELPDVRLKSSVDDENRDRWALLVIDLLWNPSAVLHWLARKSHTGWNLPVVIAMGQDHQWLEWTIRELGATWILFRQESMSRAVAACRRILNMVDQGTGV